MKRKEDLLQKITSKEARIGVIGLGYVGLPLVVAFAGNGFKVIGIDVLPETVGEYFSCREYRAGE